MSKKKRKVLLIGWDAADWKVINPLIEAGQMPTLERLINNGVMGNIATLEPPFSPMLWTSVATGMRADKHGILGFIETDPKTKRIRPVSSLTRRVKAIWNILTQEGYKTHTVSWWPTHPSEPINGVAISNHYQKASAKYGEPWKMAPGTVYPKSMEDTFAELRIHPAELTAAHILPFIPQAAKIDQEKDKRLLGMAKILAETASVQAATTEVLQTQDWDFMAIYFDGIDHFSHGFMDFHPPRRKSIPPELFEIYKDVVNGAYRFHDMMLERQLELAGPDTTVILISDHGFHSDHLRPKMLPDEPAGPANQHRPYGIICMSGPGIAKDERIYGATLLDITPTILSLFDLPIGKDMDGTPLVQAFEKQPEIKTIESWEKVEGESGMHPEDMKQTPFEAQAEIEQLVELGYIERPDENIEKAMKTVQTETTYNLARVYIGAQRHSEAIPLLEDLLEEKPKESRFALRLVDCYVELGEIHRATELIEDFKSVKMEQFEDPTPFKELEAKKADMKENDYKLEFSKLRREKAQIQADMATLDFLQANLYVKENRPKKALEFFHKIKNAGSLSKGLYAKIGNAYTRIGQWEEAEEAFKKALTIDNDFSVAYHGLAVAYLRQGRYEDSIEQSLNALGLLYHNPVAHYHLGEALYHIEYYERAAEAFEVALAMNPNIGKARNFLIEMYEEKLNEPEKAQLHREILEKIQKGQYEAAAETTELLEEEVFKPIDASFYKNNEMSEPIVIVSGLPRSGTSMMMQMLAAAGFPIYTDNKRQADESNPKGYYEHEAVMRLSRDKKWLSEVKNKAVKIISHLLFQLPARFNYKIVFMLRDIDEIVNSQSEMLKRADKKKKAEAFPFSLATQYAKNQSKILKWAQHNANVNIMFVNYKDVISNPAKEAERVAEFLGTPFDTQKMAQAVDKKLYRVKK